MNARFLQPYCIIREREDNIPLNVQTIRIQNDRDGEQYAVFVQNLGMKEVHVEEIGWRNGEGISPFATSEQTDLCVYTEGWGMTTPAGVKRYGDTAFQFNPSYRSFVVPFPDAPVPENCFRAENAILFRRDRGTSLLFGFITATRAAGCFLTELSKTEVRFFEAKNPMDGILLAPGEAIQSETLVVLEQQDPEQLLVQWAKLLAKTMAARSKFQPPRVWCSWYHYFEHVSEQNVMDNVKFLARNRERFPIEYIQLDDGYQRAHGDWLDCNERFPEGLLELSRKIQTAGFAPALWVAPFLVDKHARLLANHPDWMLHDEKGALLFPVRRGGRSLAVLDGSHPEVQTHLQNLFATLGDWGFAYVKLDFLVHACTCAEARPINLRTTRIGAFREGLAAIRRGFGEDRFILGCTAPLSAGVGIFDAARIAPDTPSAPQPAGTDFAEAPTAFNNCRNIGNRHYMNGILWINDPDAYMLRDGLAPLPAAERRMLHHAQKICAGSRTIGDCIADLSAEEADNLSAFLHRKLPDEIIPLDRWDAEKAHLWRCRGCDGREWIVDLNVSE